MVNQDIKVGRPCAADDTTAEKDLYYMSKALELAKQAEVSGEVPVGAVLVHNDTIIAQGYNQPITTQDPTAHAEIIALRDGSKHLGNYRLLDTILYVTLEPCLMCAGAMVHARIKRLVFGAYDLKTGAAGSAFDMLQSNQLNHKVDVAGGCLAEACGEILSNFFAKRRKSTVPVS